MGQSIGPDVMAIFRTALKWNGSAFAIATPGGRVEKLPGNDESLILRKGLAKYPYTRCPFRPNLTMCFADVRCKGFEHIHLESKLSS